MMELIFNNSTVLPVLRPAPFLIIFIHGNGVWTGSPLIIVPRPSRLISARAKIPPVRQDTFASEYGLAMDFHP